MAEGRNVGFRLRLGLERFVPEHRRPGRLARGIAGRRLRDLGRRRRRLGLHVLRIVLAHAGRRHGTVVVGPLVADFAPLVAEGGDLLSLCLCCEGCIPEGRRPGPFARRRASGFRRNGVRRLRIFGDAPVFVLIAHAHGNDGVSDELSGLVPVGDPVIGRIRISVPGSRERHDLDFGDRRAGRSRGSGRVGDASVLHGSRIHFHESHLCLVLVNVCAVVGAGPGRRRAGVILRPGPYRLAPVMAEGRNVVIRLRLSLKGFVLEDGCPRRFADGLAGGGLRHFGRGLRDFHIYMRAVVTADTDRRHCAVVRSPAVTRGTPVMADSRDVGFRLRLRLESVVPELRSPRRLAGGLAGGGLRHFRFGFCRFGLHMRRIVRAHAGRGYRAVVLGPHVRGGAPGMAGSGNVGFRLCLRLEGFVLEHRRPGRLAGGIAGGSLRHFRCGIRDLGLNMGSVPAAGAGRDHLGVAGRPRVRGAAPVVTKSIDVRDDFRLRPERRVLEHRRIGGLALLIAGRIFRLFRRGLRRLALNMSRIVGAYARRRYGTSVRSPVERGLAPGVAEGGDRFVPGLNRKCGVREGRCPYAGAGGLTGGGRGLGEHRAYCLGDVLSGTLVALLEARDLISGDFARSVLYLGPAVYGILVGVPRSGNCHFPGVRNIVPVGILGRGRPGRLTGRRGCSGLGHAGYGGCSRIHMSFVYIVLALVRYRSGGVSVGIVARPGPDRVAPVVADLRRDRSGGQRRVNHVGSCSEFAGQERCFRYGDRGIAVGFGGKGERIDTFADILVLAVVKQADRAVALLRACRQRLHRQAGRIICQCDIRRGEFLIVVADQIQLVGDFTVHLCVLGPGDLKAEVSFRRRRLRLALRHCQMDDAFPHVLAAV